jgi:hypothetical protein
MAAEPTREDMTAEALTHLPRVLKVLGTVVAPTTLLTALLFYFGLVEVDNLYRRLGVSATVLDLTLQDYLVQSADGLFVPAAIGAGAVLVAVWAHHALDGRLSDERGEAAVRAVTPAVAVTGLALLCVAVAGIRRPAVFTAVAELPGLCLVTGALALAFAARMLRRRQAPAAVLLVEWVALFAVVSIGLFWAVGNYAAGVGRARADQVVAELPGTADAVVFSAKSLALDLPVTTCADAEGAYRFRYTGLKLVLRVGEQYLLLPADWTPETGRAVLLPRSADVRLEFAAPGAPRNPTC